MSNDKYYVVVNDEEQYSIWKANKELPLGWKLEGYEGGKEECLDYIEKTWTNILPKSMRS